MFALGEKTSHADPPRFRVTWLTDPSAPDHLGFFPDVETYGTMGINNKGQVVYGYTPDAPQYTPIRAWVWLPEADYSLSAGWYVIGDDQGLNDPNIARDINENGIIAGQSGGIGTLSGVATVWNIANSLTPFQTYLPLESASNSFCRAHAVNNDSPPIVVGTSYIKRYCCYGATNFLDVRRSGWKLTFAPLEDIVQLYPGSNRNYNTAYDVNTIFNDDPLIAGFTTCNITASECIVGFCGVVAFACNGDLCERKAVAATWDVGGDTEPYQLMSQVDSDGRCEAYGINNANELVGWGMIPESLHCVPHAAYWSSPTATVYDLGQHVPNGHGSQAFAINLSTPRMGVGWDVEVEDAILWEPTGSTPPWQATKLNDVIGGASAIWTDIYQAHDVNDNGWIAGMAFKDGVNGLCAVVLTPIPACTWDVTGDGCVNSADASAILSQDFYGEECPPSVICVWDLNMDYLVDEYDIVEFYSGYPYTGCPTGFCSNLNEEEQITLQELITLVYETNHSPERKAEIILGLVAAFE